MEPEVEPVSEKAEDIEAEEADELDLSDLEAMLDMEDVSEPEEGAEPEDVELELDLDMEPELEAPAEDVLDIESDEAELVDLSELEEMLDVEEIPDAEGDAELEGLELDLEMEDEAEAVELSEEPPEADILEFDEIDTDVDEPELAEISEEEGVDLDFEKMIAAEPEEAEIGEEAFYVETQVIEPGELVEAAEAEEEEERPVPVRKKRLSLPVLIGLAVVLLAGAAFGTLTLLNSKNIRIPFISDKLFGPEIEDPGNLMMTPLGVKGKFVENAKTGPLFVITGRVMNNYPNNRRSIKVTGKLFTKGKVAVKTETVFCGNFLSDMELANSDLAAIKKRLMNRFGDKKSNVSVNPGRLIPFMVVFSNLPDNLDEFSIEVAGSGEV